MKIVIKNGADCNIRLWFPTALVFNRLTALFIPAALQQNGIHVTPAQALALVKIIRDSKHHFKDWTLVEVQTTDGSGVFIRL